jgi:hypothetical protein
LVNHGKRIGAANTFRVIRPVAILNNFHIGGVVEDWEFELQFLLLPDVAKVHAGSTGMELVVALVGPPFSVRGRSFGTVTWSSAPRWQFTGAGELFKCVKGLFFALFVEVVKGSRAVEFIPDTRIICPPIHVDGCALVYRAEGDSAVRSGGELGP